ncbi:ThiF family adenylyltransferase [Sphaerisporangium sp. B11E5]|uniref:ThiF family adenylyltransferase n=1 Tax=Sphaerisporangium sp. B11E5 TaxID=3153563 RepID=UPI00325D7AF7
MTQTRPSSRPHPLRPRLKPVLRRVERDDRTLQLGVNPMRAVMLTKLEPPERGFVEALDGTRTLDELVATADIGEETARKLVRLLAEGGLLDDAAVRPDALRGLSAPERERLAPDLDDLSLSPADAADAGLSALARRRRAQVRVYGAGRVGAQIAVLLAASGIGHLCVVDPAPTRHEHVVPGGLSYTDVGHPREEAAAAAARRIAPGVNVWTGRAASRPADRASPPDLVVLAPVTPLDPLTAPELLQSGIPHLLVSATEGIGTVGPLVLPGRSPCLHCLELTRRDHDPAWPLVGAHLGGYPAGEIACGTALSTAVAAQATGHALTHIDGFDPQVVGRSIDITPDWQWKRRPWPIHPHCTCTPSPQGPWQGTPYEERDSTP